MVRYEPMFFKSTDQQQDGTNEPDQGGFGDKYDIIIKFKWGGDRMLNKRKFDNIFKYLDEKKKEQWLIHIKTDRETPGFTHDIE